MKSEHINSIIHYYNLGYSLRKIQQFVPYKRETIRQKLKKEKINLRGRGIIYKDPSLFSSNEKKLLAELLGYLYGDGSLHKYKDTCHGCYECILTFCWNESDLVKTVQSITNILFKSPIHIKQKKGIFIIKFQRSLAKYFHSIGYPAGKKSMVNPFLPTLENKNLKISFLRGFFNAEATVNKAFSVQQSVRLDSTSHIRQLLKKYGKPYNINERRYYILKGRTALNFIKKEELPPSNVLKGIQSLLCDLKIPSTIYIIRLYMGKHISVHYELRISPSYRDMIKKLHLISCEKKLSKLNTLLQE